MHFYSNIGSRVLFLGLRIINRVADTRVPSFMGAELYIHIYILDEDVSVLHYWRCAYISNYIAKVQQKICTSLSPSSLLQCLLSPFHYVHVQSEQIFLSEMARFLGGLIS